MPLPVAVTLVALKARVIEPPEGEPWLPAALKVNVARTVPVGPSFGPAGGELPLAYNTSVPLPIWVATPSVPVPSRLSVNVVDSVIATVNQLPSQCKGHHVIPGEKRDAEGKFHASHNSPSLRNDQLSGNQNRRLRTVTDLNVDDVCPDTRSYCPARANEALSRIRVEDVTGIGDPGTAYPVAYLRDICRGRRESKLGPYRKSGCTCSPFLVAWTGISTY